MKRRALFWPLLAVFAIAFVVRIDLWQWHDSHFVFGLPVGLTYQIGFCIFVTLLMAVMLRFGVDLSFDHDAVDRDAAGDRKTSAGKHQAS